MSRPPLPILIVEGADCSGKTCLVDYLSSHFRDARRVHFGPFKHIKRSLARFYVEGALPAVMGYQPVIMDRSWLSELPYGTVYRSNEPLRDDAANTRMLERLILNCDPLVIYCDPGWPTMSKCFKDRQDKEYLDGIAQLKEVKTLYADSLAQTHLPVQHYDWPNMLISNITADFERRIKNCRTRVELPGIGSHDPQVLLVSDEFCEHHIDDPLYRWPFASFSDKGCSRWLAYQLDQQQIPEDQLRWINQDQLTLYGLKAMLRTMPNLHTVIGLGDKAWRLLDKIAKQPEMGNLSFEQFCHPQRWKHLDYDQPYDMVLRLQKLIGKLPTVQLTNGETT